MVVAAKQIKDCSFCNWRGKRLDMHKRSAHPNVPEGRPVQEGTAVSVEESPELPPVTIVDKGLPTVHKTSKKGLLPLYPVVTFVPAETIPVIVHGVRFQLIADVPFTGPSIVQDIYMNHRADMRDAFHTEQEKASPNDRFAAKLIGQGWRGDAERESTPTR